MCLSTMQADQHDHNMCIVKLKRVCVCEGVLSREAGLLDGRQVLPGWHRQSHAFLLSLVASIQRGALWHSGGG